MHHDLTALRGRFAKVLGAAGRTESADAVFDDLVSRHRESHRHYHTLAHVEACLDWLEQFASMAEHPEEVGLALWFHDAVYDPRAQDNERASAELAQTRLAAMGLAATVIDRIVAHILATQRHEAESEDGRLVVDLDLTILGSKPLVFDAFERDIRREYEHVPVSLFALGRRQVLQGFLERPALYRKPAFRVQFEEVARTNLKRRISELSGTPVP